MCRVGFPATKILNVRCASLVVSPKFLLHPDTLADFRFGGTWGFKALAEGQKISRALSVQCCYVYTHLISIKVITADLNLSIAALVALEQSPHVFLCCYFWSGVKTQKMCWPGLHEDQQPLRRHDSRVAHFFWSRVWTRYFACYMYIHVVPHLTCKKFIAVLL